MAPTKTDTFVQQVGAAGLNHLRWTEMATLRTTVARGPLQLSPASMM